MPLLTLPLCDIYYQSYGSGTPLVCISGFTADRHIWDGILPLLTSHFRVILFDNPACGQSSIPRNNFTIKEMAQVTIGLCDHLNIETAYFMGNSMGGAIVQQIAHDYADRIKKAVISNSFCKASDLPFRLFAIAKLAWFNSNLSLEDTIRSTLPWAFSTSFLTEANINKLIELRKNNPFPQTKEGYLAQLNALSGFDSRPWLKSIKTPCLLVTSDEDIICFEKHTQFMVNELMNSEYFSIEGVGHVPHIEKPEIFCKKIISFLTL